MMAHGHELPIFGLLIAALLAAWQFRKRKR